MSAEEIFEGKEEEALKEVNKMIAQVKELQKKHPDRFGIKASLDGHLRHKAILEAAIAKRNKKKTLSCPDGWEPEYQ